MLPVIEGVIARRVLLNFWADPAVVKPIVPQSLEVATHNGCAVVGVCLIRLEQIRPKGLPAFVGLSSENMAHRVAIRFPGKYGMQDGVYVWRRETDQGLVAAFGGRLFPGVHSRATFDMRETPPKLDLNVRSNDGTTDVSLKLSEAPFKPSKLFKNFDEVCTFFKKGDCGYSCSLSSGKLEGMQLKTLNWQMSPLEIQDAKCAFYSDTKKFPAGSIGLDCAVLMRGIPHEWHELNAIPEMARAE